MRPDLQPNEPLSQIVFVHDYMQLIFQDCSFTLWNVVSLTGAAGSLRQGAPGFCDAVVGLVGQTAQVVVSDTQLAFHFNAGSTLAVPTSGKDARGPEAWMLRRLGGPTVVEQNA